MARSLRTIYRVAPQNLQTSNKEAQAVPGDSSYSAHKLATEIAMPTMMPVGAINPQEVNRVLQLLDTSKMLQDIIQSVAVTAKQLLTESTSFAFKASTASEVVEKLKDLDTKYKLKLAEVNFIYNELTPKTIEYLKSTMKVFGSVQQNIDLINAKKTAEEVNHKLSQQLQSYLKLNQDIDSAGKLQEEAITTMNARIAQMQAQIDDAPLAQLKTVLDHMESKTPSEFAWLLLNNNEVLNAILPVINDIAG